MASDALQRINQVQAVSLREQYGDKMSNKFVEDLKGTNLFLYNWGELLSAAPTALSLMGACWLAAANPRAEMISLRDSKPENGFKYMTNVPNPTLRSCLVDVCNNGGRDAFTVAGANMDALWITSKRICDERITMVFKRLGRSTASQEAYEDFKDALDDFASDAKTCARLATQMREAFGKWSSMVGELHAATENKKGLTEIDLDKTRTDELVVKIEEVHASASFDEAKKLVARAAAAVDKQQKNLDTMIDKVPGPWESVLQSAVSSFAQAVPTIIGGALMAKANPLGLAAGALAGQAGAGAGAAQNAPTNSTSTTSKGTPQSQAQPPLADPAYATAATILDLVNHFYEYMGGEKGDIKWDKFKETTTTAGKHTDTDTATDGPQGLAYLLGTLKGQKQNIDVTNTPPNKKLIAAYDALIGLATELQAHLRKQNQMTAVTNPAETVVKEWKDKCKKARDDVLELAASAKAMGSTSVPMPFGNIQVSPPDLSAQTAQLNTAMQGVQIAQAALDNAEKAWGAAVEKQEKTAKAMSTIQAKLKKLQSTGKTLEEIKNVLRDCIEVLVDLRVEIEKLERFFVMLHTIIENIVMPRAQIFERELGKAGLRATKSGVLRVDDISKQAIYTSTLQLKAYFSLLQDISQMYSLVHRDHIVGGVELCFKLSKGTTSNNPMPELQEELARYTDNAAKKVAAMVKEKQDEIRNTLRARARRAVEETRMIEAEIAKFGVAIDHSAKKAIEAGAQEQKAAAQLLVKSEIRTKASLHLVASEDVDASEL
ncbi:hypothetical protein VTI74DRAFT_422 [Chaetomium olivicolor]